MKSLLIVLNDLPYKSDKAYNALRLAGTAADNGTQVTVFLMGDSVYTVRKDQRPVEGLPNLEDMVVELVGRGVKFKLCSTCVNARGFEPTEGEVSSCFTGSNAGGGLTAGDLITGSQMSTMVDFVILVDVSEKVVSF